MSAAALDVLLETHTSAPLDASGSPSDASATRYKILDQKLFEGLYAGVSLEAGRMEKPLVPGNNAGWLKSSTLFVGMDTIVGPLYVGYGWAPQTATAAHTFILGRP